jgi:hypothetical protein
MLYRLNTYVAFSDKIVNNEPSEKQIEIPIGGYTKKHGLIKFPPCRKCGYNRENKKDAKVNFEPIESVILFNNPANQTVQDVKKNKTFQKSLQHKLHRIHDTCPKTSECECHNKR